MRRNQKILNSLIFLLAFFCTWGEGLQQIIPIDVSKIFLIMSILLIGYWVILERTKIVFPKYFNLFTIFLILHTITVYTLFFRSELQFGYIGESILQDGYYLVQEATGNIVLRYFLFIAVSYALACVIKNINNILALIFGYGMGLAFVVLLGGYNIVAGSLMELRTAGGYMDPNAFGLSGLVAIFLGIFGYSITNNFKIAKFFSVIFIILGILAIFYSSSRGAAIGMLVGIVTLLITSGKPSKVVSFGLVAYTIFIIVQTIIPEEIISTLFQRIDLGRLQFDRGAHRLDIWLDYFYAIPDYWIAGTGLSRAIEAIRYSGAFKLANTHNLYLQVLVEFGIGGFALFIIAIIQLIRKVVNISFIELKFAKSNILALFFAWMANSFFLNTFNLRDTWIVIALIVACIKIDKENNIENIAY